MDEREVKITRPEKVLFPTDGLTKGDLIDYYRRIAPRMLPYLRSRPLVMQRFPDGIDREGFFQKAISPYYPKWIERISVKKEGGTVQHVVCNDAETLLYLANQAVVTFHIWLSRVDNIYFPDQMAFDLDPSGDDFSEVIATARSLRQLLDRLGLPNYLKTTGSRGLHIVAPLTAEHDYDEVRTFSREIAQAVVEEDPEHRTLEQSKNKRRGRLLIDINRNAYAQTFVAPFSVRPRAGAPVSAPIDWSELDKKRLRPDGFNIGNVFDHLEKNADPWKTFGKRPGSIESARKKFANFGGGSLESQGNKK